MGVLDMSFLSAGTATSAGGAAGGAAAGTAAGGTAGGAAGMASGAGSGVWGTIGTAVGSYFGGPVGGAVGSKVGGVIDNLSKPAPMPTMQSSQPTITASPEQPATPWLSPEMLRQQYLQRNGYKL